MYHRHRIPCLARAQQGRQLTESGSQRRRLLGRELPHHIGAGQLPVGVSNATLVLPTLEPAQRLHPQPQAGVRRQPVIQLGQQLRTARQQA
jgi:hypothetical protein